VNLSLILELVKQELKNRYADTVLGVWWVFLWPVFLVVIYTLIFSKLIGVKLGHKNIVYAYSIYLSSGIFPWFFFANSIIRMTGIFTEKKFLFTKIPIKLEIFPIVVLITEFINYTMGISFVALLSLLFLGLKGLKHFYMFPLAVYLMLVYTLSFGLILGTLNVFFRDLKEIVGISLQVFFWFNPIVYTLDILPNFVQRLIYYNPMYPVISIHHLIFVNYNDLNLYSVLGFTLISPFALLLSYYFFKKLEKDIRDFV